METSLGSTGVSGIILAGGRSNRLGRNKALEQVGRQPIISLVLETMTKLFSENIVVVADVLQGRILPIQGKAKVIQDSHPGKGSLGGVYTGLAACTNPWGMVVACDMPFLNVDLISHMVSLRQEHDAVVPVVDGQLETTHAVYSKACVPKIEARLKVNDLKISRFYEEVRVKYLPETEIGWFDPEGLSFFNINTQKDLDRARALASNY